MSKGRILFLAIILMLGISLVITLVVKKAHPPMDSTLAPTYELVGKPVNTFSRALTRVLPINSLSEKDYGDAIAERYAHLEDPENDDYRYLNEIIPHLAEMAQKPFTYRVYVLKSSNPNAFAMPGGVILVTEGLLDLVETEGELVSILAHEMGHIERSHCLEAVRFQLVSKKIGSRSLGKLADFAVNLMLRHSYSKTQEAEADEYAYRMILNSKYDPSSVGDAFKRLLDRYQLRSRRSRRANRAHVVRDYFMTHPPMALRHEKYTQLARVWWENHPNERRYRGKKNLQVRISFYGENSDPAEWRSGPAE